LARSSAGLGLGLGTCSLINIPELFSLLSEVYIDNRAYKKYGTALTENVIIALVSRDGTQS